MTSTVREMLPTLRDYVNSLINASDRFCGVLEDVSDEARGKLASFIFLMIYFLKFIDGITVCFHRFPSSLGGFLMKYAEMLPVVLELPRIAPCPFQLRNGSGTNSLFMHVLLPHDQ